MGKLNHLGFILRAKGSHWRILRQGRSDTIDFPFWPIALAATWGMTRSWGGARMQPGAGKASEEAAAAIRAVGAKARTKSLTFGMEQERPIRYTLGVEAVD